MLNRYLYVINNYPLENISVNYTNEDVSSLNIMEVDSISESGKDSEMKK